MNKKRQWFRCPIVAATRDVSNRLPRLQHPDRGLYGSNDVPQSVRVRWHR